MILYYIILDDIILYYIRWYYIILDHEAVRGQDSLAQHGGCGVGPGLEARGWRLEVGGCRLDAGG